MVEDMASLPPLQGCLYCHSEGTITRSEPRRFLGFGDVYPQLKCSACGAVALFDLTDGDWRIRYKRFSRAASFYYVALHLGAAGWLSSGDALDISTEGFVQRKRVEQAKVGKLSWLQAAPLLPPPPLMTPEEKVFLSLRGVAYQQSALPGFWARSDQAEVLDTGTFYGTDYKLHLLGQRRDWSHRLSDIRKVAYDHRSWTIYLNTAGSAEFYRGMALASQMDPQLFSAVVEALWHMKVVGELGDLFE